MSVKVCDCLSRNDTMYLLMNQLQMNVKVVSMTSLTESKSQDETSRVCHET